MLGAGAGGGGMVWGEGDGGGVGGKGVGWGLSKVTGISGLCVMICWVGG